jgi:hypothetical protein
VGHSHSPRAITIGKDHTAAGMRPFHLRYMTYPGCFESGFFVPISSEPDAAPIRPVSHWENYLWLPKGARGVAEHATALKWAHERLGKIADRTSVELGNEGVSVSPPTPRRRHNASTCRGEGGCSFGCRLHRWRSPDHSCCSDVACGYGPLTRPLIGSTAGPAARRRRRRRVGRAPRLIAVGVDYL